MARRSYGEGSIFIKVRRGKTYHVARLTSVEVGRRRCREVWCKDATAARKALRGLKEDRAKGKQVFGKRIAIFAYLSAWHQERVPHVAPQTSMDYLNVLMLHMKPFLGAIPLAGFTGDHALELYAALRRRRRSTAAIKRVHKVLHKALADAVRRGLIDRNPLDAIDAPAHRTKEVEPYTIDEIRSFLAAAQEHRLEALWVLALFSQAREGELFALRWRDVDLEAGMISVSRGLQDVSYSERRIADPKNLGSRRRIDLPPIAVRSLEAARARAAAARGFRDTDLVFPDRKGGPLRRQNLLRRELYPLMEKAELRRIHFHALRHSGATLLAESIPLVALKERLGHASISTTANVYVHKSPSLGRLAVDQLDRLFPADGGLSDVE